MPPVLILWRTGGEKRQPEIRLLTQANGGLEAFTNIASGFCCPWCLSNAPQIKTDSAKIYRHSLVYLVTERGKEVFR